VIEARQLTKMFGLLAAVNNVSIEVRQGDIFGLVGPDGAGKTTLLRMLCGLITPTSGAVALFGGGQKNNRKSAGVFGYMPQRFSLYGDLTVWENIHFFGSLYDLSTKTIRERADEILEMTDLIEFKSRLADNLSGGMKQKLALTCALVARPSLMILDEPTFGVDPQSRKEFWRILYRLNRDGVTLLVSTPYMDEAELCKKVALMDGGKIAVAGAPDFLKSQIPQKILEIKADVKDLDFLENLPEVVEANVYGDRCHVSVNDTERAKAGITSLLSEKGIHIISFEEITPSMEDVFVSLTGKEAV